MSRFAQDITVTHLSGELAGYVQLQEPLVFNGITVPKGFISDGPTIPAFLWPLLPPWKNALRAGVLHDWLCYLIERGTPDSHAPSRMIADDFFLEALKSSGVGKLEWLPLYIGARIGTLFGVRTTMIDHNSNL